MPTLRSAAKKRLQSEIEQEEKSVSVRMSKKTKTIIKNEEITQWLMIGPDELFSKDDVLFSRLPHPQNGVVSLFAFKNNKVFEMMKYKEVYRSWFLDETVQKDGSLTFLTPIDPLFLAIPFFEKASSVKRNFMTLDNILMDDEHTSAPRQLESCLSQENLENICDCKGSDDLIVYKINDDKVLDWLIKKVKKIADFLQNSHINVKHGAQISGFVRNSDGKKNSDDCLRYGWELVSDYITEEKSERLKEKLGIKDPVKVVSSTDPPAAKKQKFNNNNNNTKDEGCLEDYRDDTKTAVKKAIATKVSRAQKQLDKVDKKGMKTMTSFFTAKPKKK